jgi:hypothetical protein
MDLARDWVLNLDLRKIGALPNPASPIYELDARIGWSVSPSVDLSLNSRPLQLGSTDVETGRSFFIESRWRF